ncbi:MAG: type IV toxin-antitoxin system AbiEi family antitoxin domain-containing protein [Candidatus Thiodiazotropha endolucinida]|nr:type IV toxin-antitoxin system AbiEi family antitoxin domain-containing protein [Candidatus Thiodiazotropha taylori]MCG8094964.1 type IV toxin-antitoxin system AbiEi family antitoxin domain-containing protein [Candidatus Thiodiazotropha endolucinida]MCG8046325.1 type IV toxin-antitoxin system AbiEi family antitoxin domain-containing protein [Candidatus Thiodiazotropha taylori]MCG8065646.1 type IV toxin-antitoxin system AbiEi family antitoxin domain-containing protein [Candidatus Thiodiazotrop
MVTQTTKTNKVLDLVRKVGVLRPRDLDPYNIPRTYLSRLCVAGKLQRIGRGLYVLPGSGATEHHSMAEACKRVPKGVVCLLSALSFHELTTQAPFEVWLAIGEKAWRPRLEYPPLRIVHFSKAALNAGVEEHQIEGVNVHVYSPAKTVADCFKYRNKIGLDVAIEALRECRRARHCTMDDLWHYADICRVRNVMRPYLESLAV